MQKTPASRDTIVKSAGEIFAAKGFLETTVREIADEVGILSGSLYHHFPSKEALALEIVRGYYDKMLQRFTETASRQHVPADSFKELVRVSCLGIEESPGAVGLMLNSGDYLLTLPRFAEVVTMSKQIQSIWYSVFEAGKLDGTWAADLDPAFLYRSIRDVLAGTVRWWRGHGAYGIAELSDRYSRLFLFGLFGANGTGALPLESAN
jgi:AcrR family transcriptional regulator